MFPTFVGIGVPRAGTTWLHELLDAHPQVAVPTRRKEVHFFDVHFDRGIDWYEAFFPRDPVASGCQAAGEITPHYLYHDQCPARIAELPSVRGLILMLRNPVERTFSHYIWRMRTAGYQGSFDQFLEDVPEAIPWGRYAENLRKYLPYFPLDRILILVHDRMFDDVPATRARIAEFLGVDVNGFPEGAGTDRVNPGSVPRFRTLSRIASKANLYLRRRDIDWLPGLAKKLGAKRLLRLEAKGPAPTLSPEWRSRLRDLFIGDIEDLETLAGLDLGAWKDA
jgi:hypothetical protein